MSYPGVRYGERSEIVETIEGITVAELIAQLQRLPPDDRVAVEGCDCIGPAGGIRRLEYPPPQGIPHVVLITRKEGAH